jgi:hypothetical protein
MKEMRAQLNHESRPHGLRFPSDLNGEVLRRDEVGIATAAIALRLVLCARPLGAVNVP